MDLFTKQKQTHRFREGNYVYQGGKMQGKNSQGVLAPQAHSAAFKMDNQEKETQMYRTVVWTLWEKVRVGCFKRTASKRILSRVKQITSPGWMHETSAQTWCTGKTQRDWVEREVGGGIGMGNTCKPMAVSFQCMTKSTTILKIKNLK